MDLRQTACVPAIAECATTVAATPLHSAPHLGRPRLAEDVMSPSLSYWEAGEAAPDVRAAVDAAGSGLP
ncbi:hypothetical protein AQI96_36705 [Streptomyces canus]|nr:hypothetical protein AQI96_36705 [Streptomyces canus]